MPNYSDYTVAQLKTALTTRGIKFPSSSKKEDLVELMEKYWEDKYQNKK